jgi:uncharacterized membrane protein YqiK
MRRLSKIIAVNKKERAAIEADAELSVRQSQLESTKRRLLVDQEEEQAQIAQNREIETTRAKSLADVAQEKAESDKRRDAARIEAERETRLNEIARDREVNRQRLESDLNVDSKRGENAVALVTKKIEEVQSEARVNPCCLRLRSLHRRVLPRRHRPEPRTARKLLPSLKANASRHAMPRIAAPAPRWHTPDRAAGVLRDINGLCGIRP